MKWIFSIIGFLLTRKFWGAILGYIVGVLFEKMKSSPNEPRYRPFKEYRQDTPAETFEVSLLSLCAIIIKADGRTTQQELDYVRHKFVAMYGQDKANSIFRTFNDIVKHREVSAQRICSFIRARSGYETRLQILHFLFEIAASDGKISDSEYQQIQRISEYFYISWQDFESIKAMFVQSEDDAYKILEISKDASDNEVKKAYREMAKKYHPDRVITDDEAIKKGAEEKFKKVQQAYEKIQKERKFN